MSNASQKARDEREAFCRFANLRDESALWLRVESRVPPEPDLLCVHRDRGEVAFELVAITDPVVAEVTARHERSTPNFFWTSDPTERIVRHKLGRRYQSRHSIELLIYNDGLVITPEEVIVEVALCWLGSKDHPFARAWFMGEFEARPFWQAADGRPTIDSRS